MVYIPKIQRIIGKKRWDTFQHNGVVFPEPYIYKKIPLIYNGKNIILNELAEEACLFYVKYLDTDYVKSKTFNRNFFKDWKNLMDSTNKQVIETLDLCDFKFFTDFLNNERERKALLTKVEKEKIKSDKDKKYQKFKIAFVDGKEQPIGNFLIEPPGLFLGRGCHPKAGKIKKRIQPEDITLNLGKDAPIPQLPAGKKWGEIIHDQKAIWLASWYDSITGKPKYVWLSDKAQFKAESDKKKFDLAKKLKKKIGQIRKSNDEFINSSDNKKRQLGTAMYFIDKLALRVGNEKSKDQADTVGVTSLRIEHITLLEKPKIKLDFLGKDSIRYVKKFDVSENVFENLSNFMDGKDRKQQLFDLIQPSDLNEYLQSFMAELTSKVFRTFNASNLFQRELNAIEKKFLDSSMDDITKLTLIMNEYNKANAKVAILCNHQKNVSKGFGKQMDKIDERLKELKSKKLKYLYNKQKKIAEGKKTKSINEKIKRVSDKIKILKEKKKTKIEMKSVSLGTSKVNYIDPRISVVFMNKFNIPPEKIFTKTLLDKFQWAIEDVKNKENWSF